MASLEDGQGRKRKRRDKGSRKHESKRPRVAHDDADEHTHEHLQDKTGQSDDEAAADSNAATSATGKVQTAQLTPTQPSRNVTNGIQDGKEHSSKPRPGKPGKDEKEPAQSTTVDARTKKKNKRQAQKRSTGNWTWTMSEPSGGTFQGMRPLFSQDEKHLIVATQLAVNIYSTSTSLLVQSLSTGSHGRVAGYCFSAVNDNTLYMTTDSGVVTSWDWLEGKRLGRWDTKAKTRGIFSLGTRRAKRDTFFVIDHVNKFNIAAHRFGDDESIANTEVATLLSIDKPLKSLQVLANGRAIIALSSDSIICGKAAGPSSGPLKDLQYTWTEVPCREAPTCFAVISLTSYRKEPNPTPKKKKPAAVAAAEGVIDVAVGGVKGCIYLYQDLFGKLAKIQQPGKAVGTASEMSAQELHWHREAVGTVAWSLDGNYIISGGRETVLVLWQLATGKKQFLPHLESPIQDLAVAPSGSSYAVRLGDNSVMVLSTSELAPTANVAGLQSFTHVERQVDRVAIPTIDAMLGSRDSFKLDKTRVLVNPRDPNQLLVAVPAYQADKYSAIGSASAPYLQTFDMRHTRHLSRQALSRTNATNTNIGPEGNRIKEPDVTLMAITSSGAWLATVEEWEVPKMDIETLDMDEAKATSEKNRRCETQLRFWSFDSDRQSWALNTRIEAPHQAENTGAAGRVLALIESPTGTEFATVGEDATIRIWSLRRKLKNGTTVRSTGDGNKTASNGATETWWAVSGVIPLEMALETQPLRTSWPSHAELAYSTDGTILAASLHFESQQDDVVYFIDAVSGTVRASRDELCQNNGQIHAIGFMEQCLIVVAQHATFVWDITSFEMQAYIPFDKDQASSWKLPARLSIDDSTGTFAIAVPRGGSKRRGEKSLAGLKTILRIYSPSSGESCLFEREMPSATLALLPAGSGRSHENGASETRSAANGHLILDLEATIRHVRPKGSMVVAESVRDDGETHGGDKERAVPMVEEAADESDEAWFDGSSEGDADEITREMFDRLAAEDEDHRPVVRPEQLELIFDHPSHAMPPIRDLFADVVKLYAGKVA